MSCNPPLTGPDQELIREWDLLAKTGGDNAAEADNADSDDEPSEESGSGNKV
jgi:hypothetical protein